MDDARARSRLGGLGGGLEWEELVRYGRLNQHALGPGPELEQRWRAAGLELPDLDAMARHRLAQLRSALADHGCDGALLYDPINLRYATATSNMSLWCMHTDA